MIFMIRTSTPSTLSPLPATGTAAMTALRQGGMVLLPTANLWQLVVEAKNFVAIKRLTSLCPVNDTNRPELIFADRETLLRYFPRLHPKLDTLLSYHGRALTVLTPTHDGVPDALVDKNGEVAVRVAIDKLTHQLCKDLNGPLAATLAMGCGQEGAPISFGKVRSDVVRAAAYTVKRRQRDQLGTLPAVRIRMDGDDVTFM